MDSALITVLNMSLTGAFVIAAIVVARFALKKAPKMISYCLWAVAGFRLAIPFSFESVLSLMPFKAQPIPQGLPDYTAQQVYTVASGTPDPGYPWLAGQAAGPQQVLLSLGFYIWLLGALVMLICGMVSFLRLKRAVSGASLVPPNIYEADNIETPFVLGVLKPAIYIPSGLTRRERSYIVLHEQTHIRRRDHLVKFAAYFILCLHWFNPLAWAAFLLMGVDMEMSCDERVLKVMGAGTKKDYSQSLVRLATQRRVFSGSPLAFGEGGVKERVRNILSFGKTSWLVTITAVVLALLFSVGFSVDRAASEVTGKIIGSGEGAGNSPGQGLQDGFLVIEDDENQPAKKTLSFTELQSPPNKRNLKYMALSAKEAGTDSFAKLISGDGLPYDRYYYGIMRRGDDLIISYTFIE